MFISRPPLAREQGDYRLIVFSEFAGLYCPKCEDMTLHEFDSGEIYQFRCVHMQPLECAYKSQYVRTVPVCTQEEIAHTLTLIKKWRYGER